MKVCYASSYITLPIVQFFDTVGGFQWRQTAHKQWKRALWWMRGYHAFYKNACIISSLQFNTLFNITFSEVVDLLEEVGFPHQNCPLEMQHEYNASEDRSRWLKHATRKLHLPSSVAVLGTAWSPHSAERRPAQPERFIVGMQTCWKYAGPAPRIQLNARNAILNCIRWDAGSQCRTSKVYHTCHSQSPYKQRRSSPSRVVAWLAPWLHTRQHCSSQGD